MDRSSPRGVQFFKLLVECTSGWTIKVASVLHVNVVLGETYLDVLSLYVSQAKLSVVAVERKMPMIGP
ncbi:MAG: hypothetical protein MK165_01740 [Pirellulaceae bacterium]|nr:hypothetical protein [Pirellulaceae bacterium]